MTIIIRKARCSCRHSAFCDEFQGLGTNFFWVGLGNQPAKVLLQLARKIFWLKL